MSKLRAWITNKALRVRVFPLADRSFADLLAAAVVETDLNRLQLRILHTTVGEPWKIAKKSNLLTV